MMKATIFQLKINEYRKNRSNCRTKNYLKTSAQLTIHKDGATDDDSVTAYRLIEGARPLDEDDLLDNNDLLDDLFDDNDLLGDDNRVFDNSLIARDMIEVGITGVEVCSFFQ
jgi:hypothetical protein